MVSRRKQMHLLKRVGLQLLPSQRLSEEPSSASEEGEVRAIDGGPLVKIEEEGTSPEGDWACRLVPLLTGKALEAYTAMDEQRSDVYRHLKEALIMKFDITPETYRLRFHLERCQGSPTIIRKRITMDIVGPLQKSSLGHEFILMVCDYATHFPETFPLHSTLIKVLIPFLARVGIPEEIITDQASNFTSKLMKQLHSALGIKGIHTTSYHAETNGLVERLNQMLKSMLHKFVSNTGPDWDKWLPFVLFAYREVPQGSTGFLPLKLLYVHPVQGPLDLLQKSWEARPTAGESVLSYILQMSDRL
ncbi:hypothetical protein AAFF_G00387850 [Aldrovandia affinis]|uniref:Integrase catalytic domain-containing protein n=1 Tax=Aldrovandia affinis TaxID=143900 RepID=A0AAD7WLI9_9TELE|nr:hypothetical protein AAFF_G00387850 [Aldrovandia affinis]